LQQKLQDQIDAHLEHLAGWRWEPAANGLASKAIKEQLEMHNRQLMAWG
jgi:hypothetical protein